MSEQSVAGGVAESDGVEEQGTTELSQHELSTATELGESMPLTEAAADET